MTWDQRLSNESQAVDHCLKLGGVLLKPVDRRVGFAPDSGIKPENETGPKKG